MQSQLSVREFALQRGIRLNAVYSAIWSGRLAAKKNSEGKWLIAAKLLNERPKRRVRRRKQVQ